MNTILFNKLIFKFSQESTWRGLIALATAFGVTFDPSQTSNIIAGGMTLIGLINIIKNK